MAPVPLAILSQLFLGKPSFTAPPPGLGVEYGGSRHQTHAVTGTGHDLQLMSWCLRPLAVLSTDTVPWGILTCVMCSMGQMSGYLVTGSPLLPKAATLSCPVLPGIHTPYPTRISPLTR